MIRVARPFLRNSLDNSFIVEKNEAQIGHRSSDIEMKSLKCIPQHNKNMKIDRMSFFCVVKTLVAQNRKCHAINLYWRKPWINGIRYASMLCVWVGVIATIFCSSGRMHNICKVSDLRMDFVNFVYSMCCACCWYCNHWENT